MKGTWGLVMAGALAASVACADELLLVGPNGEEHGPVTVQEGASVEIDGTRYVVRLKVTEDPGMVARLRAVELPEAEFRQANIRDVLDFMQEASRQYAPETGSPRDRRRGITFVYEPAPRKPVREDDAPGAERGDDPFAGFGSGMLHGGPREPVVTLAARMMNLYDMLHAVARLAGCRVEIRPEIVYVRQAAPAAP